MAFFLVEVTTARLETITDLCDRGKLTARVGAVLPLEQANMANTSWLIVTFGEQEQSWGISRYHMRLCPLNLIH